MKRAYDDQTGPAHFHAQPSWPDFWSTLIGTEANLFDTDSSDVLQLGDVGQDIEAWAADAFADLDIGFPDDAFNPAFQDNAALTSQWVCYGALETVAVKLIGDMNLLLQSVVQTLDHGCICFTAEKRHGHHMLLAPDLRECGQISDRIGSALNSLESYTSISITAFAPSAPLSDFLRRLSKSTNAVTKVQLLLSGPRSAAREVGRVLSSNSLYLQDPDYGTGSLAYVNPQILEFEDHPVLMAPDRPMDDSNLADQHGSHPLQKILAEAYRSTRRSDGLERMAGSLIVRTPLKPHQEQALSFMYQREQGPVSPEFSLWASSMAPGGRVFKHVITGDELTDRPSELGGGILSDYMGMGKTLSALALITTTCNEAVEWAHNTRSHRNDRTRSKATLVVVPSGQVLTEWEKEIRKHLDSSVTFATYHGRHRDGHRSRLLQSHIVLTTYHTLASSEKAETGLAHQLEWYRVVLDEAHVIRRHATRLFQAASRLEAPFRWCLTGTPIQNSLDDFGSLLSFARIDPFRNLSVFRRYVAQNINERSTDVRRNAIQNFALLLDSVSLRRSQELLDLPKVTEKTVPVIFSPLEQQQYKDTMRSMSKLIKEQAHYSKDQRNILNMFQAQLELRILCNHGTHQRPFESRTSADRQTEREDALLSLGRRIEVQCTSCGMLLPVTDPDRSVDRRGQLRCAGCLSPSSLEHAAAQSSLSVASTTIVPTSSPGSLGNAPASSFTSFASDILSCERREYFASQGHSSKLMALMKDLSRVPRNEKSIIFSCWTRSLDLITLYLHQREMIFGRIDGTCDQKRRQATLDQFTSDPDTRILLMTTGVGALGLNLTAANHIFILEPQWNPSTEQQAIGRASRIGQTKPVSVTRYLVKETIETVMCSQQWRKRQLARIGLDDVDLNDKEAFQLV